MNEVPGSSIYPFLYLSPKPLIYCKATMSNCDQYSFRKWAIMKVGDEHLLSHSFRSSELSQPI
jgi:hypothetical protein